MKFDSLAMIETNGFVSALVAVDKMLSLGNVQFLKKEVISNGQVTVFIIGNSSEIKGVLQAGTIAAQSVGVVISSGIVPYPNDVIEKIIFEPTTSKHKPKRVKKRIKKEEKIDTLFDQFDDETSSNNLVAEVEENNPDVAREVHPIKEQKQNIDIVEDVVSKIVVNPNDDNRKETDIPSDAPEPSVALLENEKIVIDSNEEIKDWNNYNTTDNNIIEIESESSENGDTLEEITNEEIEETSEEETVLKETDHLEQLRIEAKSEIKSETDNATSIAKLDEIKTPVDEVQNIELQTDEISEVKTEVEENIENELYNMNVPELRKLARSKEDFPIKGREISKANRKVLLEYFAQFL